VRTCTLLSAGLFLLLSAVLISEANAQFGGRGRGGGKRQDENRPQSSEPTQLSANDRFRLALTKARLALELTRAQEPAWDSYATAAIAAFEKTSPETTARLDRATESLYAVLSISQRSSADGVLANMKPPYASFNSGKPQTPFAGPAGGSNDR
jgi:hypothetical protein